MAVCPVRITNPHKVFTPVFTDLWNATERFIVNMGGTGSSKSFSSAQKEILISCQRKVNTLVIRKVNTTLKDSVIPAFLKRISEFKLSQFYRQNKTDQYLTNTVTGSQFLFRGLDDPEKLKSIEGINRIYVEEASELDIEDFLELNRRVRGVPDIQITLNFNPIHENHWLKKHFFDNTPPNTKLIHSTYKDNPFLSDEDRAQIEWMKEFNYNQYRIYALGQWGITENGNPWLFAFDEKVHVQDDIPFLPTYPIYLSFDFNADPCTCTVWQMSPNARLGVAGSFIHCIKEYAVALPLDELCARIALDYPNSPMFVTGDRSGNNSNVGFTGKNTNYYTMIASYLRLSPQQVNCTGKNLEHNDSRILCNAVMRDLPVRLSKKGCPQLIDECHRATVQESTMKPGVLRKDRKDYKMDLFDGKRYFFQTYFADFAKRVKIKV